MSLKSLKPTSEVKDVIAEHYINEYFQKADIASKLAVSERQLHRKVTALIKLAVSERQLHRKVTALIDESPMQLLRDYRLKMVSIKLKSGNQVNLVSGECGFSSSSYFSNLFKKKYGVSPKKYQNQIKGLSNQKDQSQ